MYYQRDEVSEVDLRRYQGIVGFYSLVSECVHDYLSKYSYFLVRSSQPPEFLEHQAHP